MGVRIADFSAAVKQSIGVKLASNLGDAAARLRVEIEANIGTQGPPRSAPAEFPHRDTGNLQGSFEDQLDGDDLVARVGTDVDYALDLELGTSHMSARPFIERTLIEQSDALGRIICRP